jgi:hypothetical protein
LDDFSHAGSRRTITTLLHRPPLQSIPRLLRLPRQMMEKISGRLYEIIDGGKGSNLTLL